MEKSHVFKQCIPTLPRRGPHAPDCAQRWCVPSQTQPRSRRASLPQPQQRCRAQAALAPPPPSRFMLCPPLPPLAPVSSTLGLLILPTHAARGGRQSPWRHVPGPSAPAAHADGVTAMLRARRERRQAGRQALRAAKGAGRGPRSGAQRCGGSGCASPRVCGWLRLAPAGSGCRVRIRRWALR